jgi:hypothetical protein
MSPDPPAELLEAIKDNRCAAFVGAGLSMRAGYPSWPGLLKHLVQRGKENGVVTDDRAKEFEAHIGNPNDYLMVAEELSDTLGIGLFREELAKIFEEERDPTDAHLALMKIPFRMWLTTNYDRLLENAHAQVRGRGLVGYKYDKPGDFLEKLWNKKFFLLKAHGTAEERESMVITRKDYRTIVYRSPGYRSALETIFNTNAVLFLGASMNDPELDLLLSFLHDAFQGGGIRHFALVPESSVTSMKVKRWQRDYSIRCLIYKPATKEHLEVDDFLAKLK